MKKIILMAVALLGLLANAQAQLLYKVTVDSVTKPSYIVATHDLVNPLGIVEGIDGLKDALTNTEQLYVDTYTSPYKTDIEASYNLPAGKKLGTLLTATQTSLLDKFLKKYTEVGWAAPYSQKRYGGKTPLYVLREIRKLLFVANHMGEYDPTHTFNEYFEAQAKVNGETISSLTPVDSFIAQQKRIPMDTQVKKLVSFLENEDAELTNIDRTVEAFKRGDMDGAATAAGTANAPKNESWLTTITTAMKEKPTFFAIPCQQLGGTNGILNSLKAEGYQVEGVK